MVKVERLEGTDHCSSVKTLVLVIVRTGSCHLVGFTRYSSDCYGRAIGPTGLMPLLPKRLYLLAAADYSGGVRIL
jgi:hypothetical protein